MEFTYDLIKRGRPMVAPTICFLYSVGAIHESPVFICDNRSFSGCQGRRPTSNDNSKATNQPVLLLPSATTKQLS